MIRPYLTATLVTLLSFMLGAPIDAAESLKVLLELFNFEVTVAHTGPAGLEAARSVRPDVVLCDIGLPGMDGFAVATALRADATTTATRLIAVTGYGGAEDVQRARRAGFDDHLTKPVDPNVLLGRLDPTPVDRTAPNGPSCSTLRTPHTAAAH